MWALEQQLLDSDKEDGKEEEKEKEAKEDE